MTTAELFIKPLGLVIDSLHSLVWTNSLRQELKGNCWILYKFGVLLSSFALLENWINQAFVPELFYTYWSMHSWIEHKVHELNIRPYNKIGHWKRVLENHDIPTEDYWYWLGTGVLLGMAILFNLLFTVVLAYVKGMLFPWLKWQAKL